MDTFSSASSTTITTLPSSSSSNSLPISTHNTPSPSTTTTTTTTTLTSSNRVEDNTNNNKNKPPQSTTTEEETSVPAKRKEIYEVSATSCSNCGTTKTPLWRRAPNGDTICNACGLYYKARNQFRPPTLKRNTARKDDQSSQNDCGGGPEIGTCPGGGHCNGSGGSESCEGCPAFNQHQVNRQSLICVNCRTRNTPLWRRDEAGNTICNACGLYYKLHNMHRPVSMKRTVIKRRKRVVVAETGEESEDGGASGGESSKNIIDSNYNNQQQQQQPERKQGKRIKGLKAPTQKNDEVVPAIEDYILPKRLPPPTTTASISPPSSSLSSPTSPPNIVAPRPRLPLPQMDRIYNSSNHNNNDQHPTYLPPISSSSTSPPSSHNTSHPPPPSHHNHHSSHLQHHYQHQYQQQSQHRGIDSLLQAAADCERLPPISLPPPQPSTSVASSHPPPPSSSTSSLSEFDAALNRLNKLRSRATSQHDVYVLCQLVPSLTDLVRRAETSL
ncbi:hypothetical protein BDA99DRAFT_506404 [Phascolomyces articulosus]|uniref:GATA-type domain-containing protein n=1 Tax=Phascolomyces articulosus TaxID=60185 RepID=A0AAD5PFK4_9FUNG|nr:hypothetical protein BDA99DRAFT_506404 [Phascolomyces articulosus]